MSKLCRFCSAGFLVVLLAAALPISAVVPYQDDNIAPFRLIDDFKYADTNSTPLQNGWVIKSGTGTAVCSTLVPASGDIDWIRFARFSGSPGLGFIVQYPPDTSEIKSKRRNFAFSVRSADSFAIEAKILVRWATDSTKYYWLRYIPASGTNSQVGDTLVFYLGTGYLDGQWHVIIRDLITDIKGFLPSKSLDYLSRVFVRGSVSVQWILPFKRHNWIEGYASQSSIAQGGTLNFHISTGDNLASAVVKIEIFRFGAAGTSAGPVTTIPNITVAHQDIANTDGLSQNWPVPAGASWTVPQSAKSDVLFCLQ
jgi:hypothetical protein